MRKTHTFLEKFAQSQSIEIPPSWSTLLMGLKNPQTDHIISRGDKNEQELLRSRRREKMRGRAQEWNRERLLRGIGVAQVRGERKKRVFFLVVYKDNIKIIDGRATVIMLICIVIVAIMHKCTILHPLMWLFFCVKMCKMGTFFYFRRLYTCWCGCSYVMSTTCS